MFIALLIALIVIGERKAISQIETARVLEHWRPILKFVFQLKVAENLFYLLTLKMVFW